jgi:hypothetical protein
MTLNTKKENHLHIQAFELMVKLDEKYKMDNLLSLDEYLIEYRNKLTNEEITEITNLINKF